ncbi:MAG: phage prohead protease, partial [Herbaspirillum sp.]|nr:phage prohead protease [Herbaspirillum sp.]
RLARPFELKELKEDGTFSGYGSVFGVQDDYDDIVAPGCFIKSLLAHKAANDMPKLLWQHNSDEPIGVYTSMSEDSYGLKVDGALCLDTQKGREAYALLKMGAIKGLSIGYCTIAYNYDQKADVRTLTEVDLWECSLVTFPACRDAQVSAVKSIELIEEITDFKGAEAFLRESCKLSRQEATLFFSRVKSLTQRESDQDAEAKRVLGLLEYRNTMFLTPYPSSEKQ